MQPLAPYQATSEYSGPWHDIKAVLEYLLSPQLQQSLFPLKIIFILISLVFFLAIIYFLIKTEFVSWWFLYGLINFLFPKELRKERIIMKWKKIKRNLEKGEFESQWKLSLIAALKMFDENLKKTGYSGKNLKEKLMKLSQEEVSNLDELLRIEKICQDVVRDPDYRLTKEEVQEILENFEKALKELDVL